MSEAPPYREPASKARPAPPATLSVAWDDAENLPNPMRYYIGIPFGVLAVGMAAAWSVPGAFALAATLIGGSAWEARKHRGPPTVTLRVDADKLLIEADAKAAPVYVALEALRNVEVESKAIRRASYRQDVGAPLPTTSVSGDVDVARIVFVLEGGAAPVRLTETYASYSECMTRFGKVRVFLRAHGWLPDDERPKAP